MVIKEFSNLYNFFNYIEFCPLCKSRTSVTAVLQSSNDCLITNKQLILSNTNSKFSISLMDNSIESKKPIELENYRLIVGKQCDKYHFFYNGITNIIKDKSSIEPILLDKYHFIKMRGTTHFTVNGSFLTNSTSIRITTPDYKTREVILPLINFDLSSKKKIDLKLRNIQLLG